MRFSSRPPATASASAIHNDAAGSGGFGAAAGAAESAMAPGAPAGHGPAMSNRTWMPVDAPSTNTAASDAGLSLRCAESGTRAVQRLPFQVCSTGAAGSITLPVSGKNASVLPATAAGSPSASITSAWPSTRPFTTAPGAARGMRACAAANASPLPAVAALVGSASVNSPDSGMHTSLQTSQSARSLTRTVGAEKPAATVTGTGSSSASSKP